MNNLIAGSLARRSAADHAAAGFACWLVVLGAMMLGLASNAAARTGGVPYTDPSADGGITLCDRSGHEVTSGSIDAKPFAWRAVSSVAAPAVVQTGGKATLAIFQPRPAVSADQWNGDILTGASTYTNKSAPMAQATDVDFSLNDFLKEFSPKVDGLLQLRMFFTAPNAPAQTTSYPAANIRVTGSTWTVVGNSPNSSCTNGSATSSETLVGVTDKQGHVIPTIGANAPSTGTTSSSAKGRGSSTVSPGSTPVRHGASTAHPAGQSSTVTGASVTAGTNSGVPASSASSSEVAGQRGTQHSASPGSWFALIAVVASAAAAAVLLWRRRRRA